MMGFTRTILIAFVFVGLLVQAQVSVPESAQLTVIDQASWDSIWEYASLKYSCGYDAPEGSGVVHIPQLHGIRYLKSENSQEDYSLGLLAAGVSQYHIAALLQQSPGVAVFTEGGGKGVDAFCASMDWAKRAFPEGKMPEMGLMTHTQVEILVRLGAPCLLRALGVVPRIEETESNAANLRAVRTAKKIFESPNETQQWVRLHRKFEKAQEHRERITARLVSKYQRQHPDRTIYLVYGAGHDFAEEFKGRRFEQAVPCPSLAELMTAPEGLMDQLAGSLGKAPINRRKLEAKHLQKACLPRDSALLKNEVSIESKLRLILEETMSDLCPAYTFESRKGSTHRVVDCDLNYRGRLFLKPEGDRVCVGLREGLIYSKQELHLRSVRDLSRSEDLCHEVEGGGFSESPARKPAEVCSAERFFVPAGSTPSSVHPRGETSLHSPSEAR